jgi:hypothetical protein
MKHLDRRQFVQGVGTIIGAGIAGFIPVPAWAQQTVVGTAVSGANLAATAKLAAAQIKTNLSSAQTMLANMKNNYGSGVSTLITIANGTGANMTHLGGYDWHGKAYSSAPGTIGPGQIGIFLHVHTSGAATGSEGCLTYTLTAPDGAIVSTLLGYSVPYSGSKNQCTAMLTSGTYYLPGNYDDSIESTNGPSSNTNYGVTAAGSINTGSSPQCAFTLTYA